MDQRNGQRSSWRRLNKFSQSSLSSSSSKLSTGSTLSSSSSPTSPFPLSYYFHFVLLPFWQLLALSLAVFSYSILKVSTFIFTAWQENIHNKGNLTFALGFWSFLGNLVLLYFWFGLLCISVFLTFFVFLYFWPSLYFCISGLGLAALFRCRRGNLNITLSPA